MNNYKKCVCNNQKGNYPLKNGEIIYEQECYNMETKLTIFYLNEKANILKFVMKVVKLVLIMVTKKNKITYHLLIILYLSQVY